LTATLAVCSAGRPAVAVEHVTAQVNGQLMNLSGEAVVEASDGGILLKSADGAMHRLPAEMIGKRTHDDEPLEMLDADALAEHVLAELPADFLVHQSKNYVVCYNTTRTYAKWTSSLLEKLQKAFIAYWKKQGLDVAPPKQPLVVMVFADAGDYQAYAKRDLGQSIGTAIGYYNLESNRIMMYDLTGMQSLRAQETSRGSRGDVTALLSLPEAEPLVATIVHEATHQISFNCGLQTRLADNPLWMAEGLAVYFETPDLSRSSSWSGIGRVNYSRWDRFCDNVAQDRVASLEAMVGDDKLFRDPETAVDAYAQAWAWNYFLIRWKPKEYSAYLKTVAAKPVLVEAPPRERLADFRRAFGDDLRALEDEFFRRMDRVK
jgi:hypothetical protein